MDGRHARPRMIDPVSTTRPSESGLVLASRIPLSRVVISFQNGHTSATFVAVTLLFDGLKGGIPDISSAPSNG